MVDIPHAVLSERFQEILKGRRLISAVFLTFRFEPDFFEQEVLPALLPDVGFSNIPAIRLLQLEEALKTGVEQTVAVYYDRAGLMSGTQSAKLDVRRIATRHATGIFHPKNVLLLTEDPEPTSNGQRERNLIVAAMSANLSRAGWWENVEVCHIEEVREGETCGFRDDLLELFKQVRRATPPDTVHDALDSIRRFVVKLAQRKQRSANGLLHPRLYVGEQSVVDFIDENLGTFTKGLCLEVISPYFDKNEALPLRRLCERFTPAEVRVFLPRADDGSALCDNALYESVRTLPNVKWARLPSELVRAGKSEQVKQRMVHAKVYRFFDLRRRYEAFLVGSVNLTTPAHSRGGNLETAFLVETTPKRASEWWLEADARRPSSFLGNSGEADGMSSTPLSVRYDWAHGRAEAYWDAAQAPKTLHLLAQGAPLFRIDALREREWSALPKRDAEELARVLRSTSFLEVSEDGGPRATILVQEEGMAHKPSILLSLSAADILRYWALLTQEQRVAFLEERIEEIPEALAHLGIEAPRLGTVKESMFDSFAGIFHAFHALEHSLLDALHKGREKEAEYRLLGRKYDSLPSLLDRVLKEDDGDPVIRYVTVLCARQLVRQIERDAPAFLHSHRAKFGALRSQLKRAERVRERLSLGSSEQRTAFLEWFEQWFLTRATPIEVSV